MRALLQRVTHAGVFVDGKKIACINDGFVVLLGVQTGDSESNAAMLAKKISELRVFTDNDNKMNLSILDVEGAALVVSQFTLYADCSKGRRPSFIHAEQPKRAEMLYQYFIECLQNNGIREVKKGVFGALMEISIHNHGPVTIMLDTKELIGRGQ